MIERERTFLLKHLPKDLQTFPKKEIFDMYIPTDVEHPVIRVRKKGDDMVIMKKVDIEGEDGSLREETIIPLTKHEYRGFLNIPSKKLMKIRYDMPWGNLVAEVDIFQQDLYGLAMVDFEFQTEDASKTFQVPDFCLAEVTFDNDFAGGMLAGKQYQNLKPKLEKYGYRPLLF